MHCLPKNCGQQEERVAEHAHVVEENWEIAIVEMN